LNRNNNLNRGTLKVQLQNPRNKIQPHKILNLKQTNLEDEIQTINSANISLRELKSDLL